MEKIIIFDNFLNEIDLNELYTIINKSQYKYFHNSGYREIISSTFFSVFNTDDFFIQYLKQKIEVTLKKKFQLNRHYMHIQTFGLDGGYHIDDNGSNKYTFCLYITELNENEIDEAGGEFLIKIPDTSIIMSIDTIYNRGILFPSEYLHKGMAYNVMYSNKRLCITWKLELI